MSSIFVHIGARGGSRGIKNKNLLKINKKPLIGIAIEQAKAANKNCKLAVSSDSMKILNFSKKYGADILIKRSKNLSNSKTSKFSVWKNSLTYLKKNYFLGLNDLFLDIDCTSPLKKVSDIKKIIKKFFNLKNKGIPFDGLITITKARKNPYFNLLEIDKKKFLRISKKKSKEIVRRQDVPLVYEHVAGIYALKPSFLSKKNSLFSGNIIGFEVDSISALDIDTMNDYKIIKSLSK